LSQRNKNVNSSRVPNYTSDIFLFNAGYPVF